MHSWAPSRSPSRHVPHSPVHHSPQPEISGYITPTTPSRINYMQKQVWFNLLSPEDLDNLPQLSADLASFLEWPGKWGDAQSLSNLMAAYPAIWPEMNVLREEGDQWHSTTARGARPKSGTTPPAWPTTTSRAKHKCHTMPDLVEHPRDWVKACTSRMKEPPSWWPKFPSLYWGHAGDLAKAFVQHFAKRQAVGFQLPAAPAKKLGWWDSP